MGTPLVKNNRKKQYVEHTFTRFDTPRHACFFVITKENRKRENCYDLANGVHVLHLFVMPTGDRANDVLQFVVDSRAERGKLLGPWPCPSRRLHFFSSLFFVFFVCVVFSNTRTHTLLPASGCCWEGPDICAGTKRDTHA